MTARVKISVSRHSFPGRARSGCAGTGANLEHFHAASRVIAIEPDPRMRRQLAAKLPRAPVPVELLDALAESLPQPDGSADAVVFTCVLCTVADVDRSLAGARRVLKPTGRLVVLEHVRGTGRLAQWQDRITPVWARLMGGCHPNRDIAGAIRNAGFTFEHVHHFDPFPHLIPARPMLQATARPPAATPDETGASSQRPGTSCRSRSARVSGSLIWLVCVRTTATLRSKVAVMST
jgi:SAM-dependent methyltransferase